MTETVSPLTKEEIKKDFPFYYRLLLLIISFSILFFIYNNYILNESLYYKSFKNDYNYDQIVSFLSVKVKYQWVVLLILLIIVMLKLPLVSLILWMGFYLSNYDVEWSSILKIVTKAEFIFLIPMLISIIWFGIFFTEYSLHSLHNFHPLSLLSLLDSEHIHRVWIYPLKTLNVFELCYLLYLGYEGRNLANIEFDSPLSIIAKSYLPFLALWIIIVMFFTLNFS